MFRRLGESLVAGVGEGNLGDILIVKLPNELKPDVAVWNIL
jgi:hypothetical protein